MHTCLTCHDGLRPTLEAVCRDTALRDLLSAVAQDLKSDIRIRVSTYGRDTVNNIVRRSAERRTRRIVDRAESIGRYLRLEALDRLVGSVVMRSRGFAPRGRCRLNRKSGQ